MRLLICTQALDRNDPALGFFADWVDALAKRSETIVVVCLARGSYETPSNVHVRSLGKESGASRLKYIRNFFRFVWSERKNYDVVFVHQNQEYALLGGLLWRTLGKRVFMWRNHYAGSFLTDIAASFCDKVFCTSARSYTASYKKTVRMPVGVDMKAFGGGTPERVPNSILFLGRITPAKHPDTLLEALGMLPRDIPFKAAFVGPTLEQDAGYLASLKNRAKELGLADTVSFREGVVHADVPELYGSHGIFVNLSSSGMYDKTLFEAAASGCVVVAASSDWAEAAGGQFAFKEGDVQGLAEVLRKALALTEEGRAAVVLKQRAVLDVNSLDALMKKLSVELS